MGKNKHNERRSTITISEDCYYTTNNTIATKDELDKSVNKIEKEIQKQFRYIKKSKWQNSRYKKIH